MKLVLPAQNMKVKKVNFHTENHGDDKVTGIDVSIETQVSADILDPLFGGNFKSAFYKDGVLTLPGIGDLSPVIELQNYIVDLNWCLDPDDGIRVNDATIRKFTITPGHTAGSVALSFQIQFVPVNDDVGHWCYDGIPYQNWHVEIIGPAQQDITDQAA